MFWLMRRHPGAIRPRPRPKVFDLWTPLSEIISWKKTNGLRLPRGGLRKFDSFWPKKAGKIPEESELSVWDYSLAFPGCIASGLAARGGRARSTMAAIWAFLPSISGSLFSFRVMQYPQVRVQGHHAPGGARGKAPHVSPSCFFLAPSGLTIGKNGHILKTAKYMGGDSQWATARDAQ